MLRRVSFSVLAVVESAETLPELKSGGFGEVEKQIGQHIAALIPDGATLQMGIGTIPDAVLASLTGKRNLGVHTEMISDGVIQAMEAGIFTGARPLRRKPKGTISKASPLL
jgi:4-hydroxybutyrate CoA-transferase